MNTIVLFIRVPEYSERAVVQRVQVLCVRDARYGVIVPLEEACLHGGVEAGEHLVLADPVDVWRVGVRTRRVTSVRRTHVVVAVLCHLLDESYDNVYRK